MNDLAPRQEDPWEELRRLTDARIALGRAGTALPTRPLLEFQLAHAMARDAVVRACDFDAIAKACAPLAMKTLAVRSRATTRQEYLRRPDLGRLLDAESEARLENAERDTTPPDVALVIADGLSSLAVERQAPPFLTELLPRLAVYGMTTGPLVFASQARVALSDEIGSRLKASATLMLIGERPGLSSPDSLGVYLTWRARRGLQNADRNCISNVRPAGLTAPRAAELAVKLLRGAFHLGVSGVGLKEDSYLSIPENDAGTQ